MRAGAFVSAVAALLLLSGCGSSKHAATTRYVKQVNAVMADMRAELGTVAAVNGRFSSHANLRLLAPQLARSERTLATFAARLAALHPPPEAKPVAATLARYVALSRSLVDELHQFAVFIPGFGAAIKQADRAAAAFRRAAHTVKTPPAEVTVVSTYAAGLEAPLSALRRLAPPDVLRPTYDSEVHVLLATRATALELAAALGARKTITARALVVQLSRDAAGNGSIATQRAEIAAVRAYDAKVADIYRLERRAQQQLVRLRTS